ncbi:uncharacterized protein FPOAC1_012965 [Fusarium poae]|uniref:uncharacterized protein n=1 Tax=Fusarium poae TaxID=36050 RepID=UPI001D04D87B|nr:uncharacterized protein FPOAC1_012965 [Fusarium poae]KAG8664988.1 hypothetical protein FPOAC1_012965 [Fusarium poae]
MLLPYVGLTWQEPTNCTQEISRYEDQCSNKYREECASTQRHGGIAKFPRFKYLPTELRLAIWRAAFASIDPAVGVCTFAHDWCEITVSHPRSAHGRSPPIAHACKEARSEWFRSISICEGPDRAPEYLFVPRTLFLVPPSAVTDSQLEHLMLPIEHVAINVADSPDLFPLFEALARLPSLQTIIIIIPSDTVEEHQAINWQETIRHDEEMLSRMSKLVDAPAPDGEWHHRTYMGWVLCNYLESSMARKYYAGDKRPKIKLLVDRSGSSLEAGVNTGQPWALYFY